MMCSIAVVAGSVFTWQSPIDRRTGVTGRGRLANRWVHVAGLESRNRFCL